MSGINLSISDTDFRLLFPFHLVIDENSRIISCGESLLKSTRINLNEPFGKHFTVYRPHLEHPDFTSILENKDGLFILRTKHEPVMQIRGQWMKPEHNQGLLFVGSPWFNTLAAIKEQGLAINDFAIHDPIIDLLHVIKTNEIGMEDLREVLDRLNLQQRELEKLSLIATESINAIVITNKKGEITWVNKSFEKMTGYPLAECAGKKPGALLQGANTDKDTVHYLSEQIKNGQHFSCEILNYTKSKAPYWVRITGQPVYDADGTVEQFFAIEEDITIQKNAALQLKWSEEKYRGIIENMDLGLVEFDTEDRVMFCNQSFCRITGFHEAQLKGRMLRNVLQERNANYDASFLMKKSHRGISEVYEIEITDQSGQSKWLLVSKTLLYDTQRNITGSIGIHLDITWRKKMELELKEAQMQALESSKAKENFLVNMSHEIRTPMNVILGMSRHLSGMVQDEKQSRFLHSIISAAENLLIIINDVLDISKIESGKMDIEHIGFHPRKLLSDCTTLLQLSAEEKGLLLTQEVTEDVPEILIGDPHRLQQVLMNLCSNAIKFTEQGNVDITVYVDRQKGTNYLLKFVIEDTGIGIDKDKMEEVFESFRQESITTTRQYGGSGLGLTISRELVRLMGGDLEIDSQKGLGTRVVFELPFEIGSPTNIEVSDISPADPERLKGKRILVVEDNTMSLTLAESVLESYGATVITASNGPDALRLAATGPFDVILMDIRMPGMDGLETTRKLRIELGVTCPVIALTANTKVEIKMATSEVGVDDYILKPYKENLLIKKIEQLIGIGNKPNANGNIPAEHFEKLYDTAKLEAFTVRNPDFLRRMLRLFVEESASGFRDLKSAYEAGNYVLTGDIAHRLKPSFDQLMIAPLFEGIKKVEQLAKSGHPNKELEQLIPEMETLLNKVIEQIKSRELK